jgi:hypothetical protein
VPKISAVGMQQAMEITLIPRAEVYFSLEPHRQVDQVPPYMYELVKYVCRQLQQREVATRVLLVLIY